MISSNSAPALSQVFTLLRSSLPQYLAYARPYFARREEAIRRSLGQIVEDQDEMARRIARLLDDCEAPPPIQEFPIEFTDCHDLAIDFLLRRAVEDQDHIIQTLRSLAERLRLAPMTRTLVEETLGMGRAHREILEELAEASRELSVHPKAIVH